RLGDDWFFIPQTVYVGGWLQSMPDILGIALDANTKVRNDAISFILTWNDSYMDLDGFLTFPDGSGIGNGFEGSHDPPTSIEFTDPYSLPPVGSVGFTPDITAREIIGPLNYFDFSAIASLNTVSEVLDEGADDRPAVELDRDEQSGAGPEVITVRTLPFWPSTYASAAYLNPSDPSNADTMLPSTVDGISVAWTWIGVMEYYVDGWNAADSGASRVSGDDHLISVDGGGADAVLHIVQGDDLLGVFRVPEYANIRTASLVKVNLFVGYLASLGKYVSYFQFVPDIQIVDYNDGLGIMSAETAPAVFGVFGAAR
ncbi:MAG: hypothetical protein JW852_09715, partial [Spirochaetales bacterium]|nr:hypothetical protein [Spirochaetales bacterium]